MTGGSGSGNRSGSGGGSDGVGDARKIDGVIDGGMDGGDDSVTHSVCLLHYMGPLGRDRAPQFRIYITRQNAKFIVTILESPTIIESRNCTRLTKFQQ